MSCFLNPIPQFVPLEAQEAVDNWISSLSGQASCQSIGHKFQTRKGEGRQGKIQLGQKFLHLNFDFEIFPNRLPISRLIWIQCCKHNLEEILVRDGGRVLEEEQKSNSRSCIRSLGPIQGQILECDYEIFRSCLSEVALDGLLLLSERESLHQQEISWK